MMTLREVQKLVGHLVVEIPEVDFGKSIPAFLGSDDALESKVAHALADGLDRIEEWPSGLDPETLPVLKLRLMFAQECLRQMEESQPDYCLPGGAIPKLLHHMVIEQWPSQGMKWMQATFLPKRRKK